MLYVCLSHTPLPRAPPARYVIPGSVESNSGTGAPKTGKFDPVGAGANPVGLGACARACKLPTDFSRSSRSPTNRFSKVPTCLSAYVIQVSVLNKFIFAGTVCVCVCVHVCHRACVYIDLRLYLHLYLWPRLCMYGHVRVYVSV